MTTLLEHIECSTRLLLLAMTPRVTPANNTEYGDLLRRFSVDPDFKEATHAAARGMGIQIYADVIQHGLMLMATQGSFFSPTADSFKRRMKFRERVAYGLLHYALVAYVFPSEDALNDDFEVLSARIKPGEVARFAIESCESLKSDETTRELLNDEMVEGFTHLLSLREGDIGPTVQGSVNSMVRTILEKYEREGLFNVSEEDGQPVYRSRPQFRAQARFMIQESERWIVTTLQALRSKQLSV